MKVPYITYWIEMIICGKGKNGHFIKKPKPELSDSGLLKATSDP